MLPRKLIGPIDAGYLEEHFLEDIIGEDRRLRFGYNAKDESVLKYINSSFDGYLDKNLWFAIYDADRIVATCHVSIAGKEAEIGLTVSSKYRNQKLGQMLFSRAMIWASSSGATTIFMHCLSENKTIQHIAKKFGMSIVTIDVDEKESVLKISRNRYQSKMNDFVYDSMSAIDMSIQTQKQFMNFWK